MDDIQSINQFHFNTVVGNLPDDLGSKPIVFVEGEDIVPSHDLVNEIRFFGSNLIEVRASDLSEVLKLVSGAEVEVLSAESGEDYQRLPSFLQTRRGNQLMT